MSPADFTTSLVMAKAWQDAEERVSPVNAADTTGRLIVPFAMAALALAVLLLFLG